MRCVGGTRFELAEWVPHVRALCFVSTDLILLRAISFSHIFLPDVLLLPGMLNHARFR